MSTVAPKVWLDEWGILHVDYGDSDQITIEAFDASHRMHMEIAPRKLPVLTKGKAIGNVSPDLQRHVLQPHIVAMVSAAALVVQSAWQMHLGRLFLYFYRPPYPARLFTSERDAIEWLKAFVTDPPS